MDSDRTEFFDSHAPDWDRSEPPDMDQRLRRVVSEARIEPGMDVLDVGTGTGVLIPHLLDATLCQGRVFAIDISGEMLAAARAKSFPDCVEFGQVSMEDFECPESSYQRVMCNAVFPHFSDKIAVLANALRALEPGGMLVISHPKGRDAVNRIHREAGEAVAEDRVPTPEAMARILGEAGFVNLDVIDEPEFYLAKAFKPG